MSQHGASDFDGHTGRQGLSEHVQDDTSGSSGYLTIPPEVHQRKTKKEHAALIAKISAQSIAEKFHMPQEQAAHEFGLGLTLFKKICSVHVVPWLPPAHSHFGPSTAAFSPWPILSSALRPFPALADFHKRLVLRQFAFHSRGLGCGVFRISLNGRGVNSSGKIPNAGHAHARTRAHTHTTHTMAAA